MKKDSRHKYITYRADRDTYQITFPVTVPDPTSKKGVKKEKITKQCKTLEEALDERERLMTLFHLDSSLLLTLEKEHEKPEPLEEQEFSRLLLEWFETIKSRELSVSSVVFYRKQVNLVALALKGRKVKEITTSMLDAIILAEERRGKGITRAIRTRSAINSFLTTIGKADMKSRVKIIERYKRREALTEQEAHKILAYLIKRRNSYSFLFYMFFATGCRRSELLGLTWRYVDFKHGEIRIENVLLRNERYEYELVDKTKTKAGKRNICLPPQAMKRLKFWYIIRKSQGHAEPDDLVFVNDYERHMNPNKVSMYFHEAVVACGIKKHVSLHSARHTFASVLANAGVPLFIIQKAGGWGSLATLERIYLHEDTGKTREYLQKSGIWDDVL
ncbi:tyrosine-type recombinase/integrase [Mitsuokella multacida]|uniref:tyrosine-type recombinase/integrase n=1 Tax=Mitsuokella multacida TaxID=52226 RepID=UPI00241D1DB5|nr:site-specific integrase [Mitsuokella multacida]